MQPEISRVLVLSTAHIPREHAQEMDEHQRVNNPETAVTYDLSYDCIQWGYLVWVAEDPQISEALPKPWPLLLAYARKCGCRWIKFDCDGPVMPFLEHWDW